METSGFDTNSRNDYAANEKEDIFSLSSTQPEVHMKLNSPINSFIPKQLDFHKQVSTTVHA